MHTVLFKRQLKPLDHFRYLSKSVLHPFLKKKNKSTMFLSLSSSKPNSKLIIARPPRNSMFVRRQTKSGFVFQGRNCL